MNKKLIIGLISLIIVGIGLFFVTSKESILEKEFSKKNAKKFIECNSRYDLKYFSNVLFSKDSNLGINSVKTSLIADLSFRVFDVSDDVVKVGFFIEPETYQLNNQPQLQEFTKGLYEHIILLKLSSNGQILDFRMPREIFKDDRNVPMSLVYPLQWVYDKDAKNSYTQVEVDPIGEFNSSYTLNSKTKKSYSDNLIEVINSKINSDIMQNKCWHKNFNLEENILFKDINKKTKMNTTTSYTLYFVSNLDAQNKLMRVEDFDKLWKEYSKPTTAKQSLRDKYISKVQYDSLKSKNLKLKDLIKDLKKGSKHELEDQLLAYLLNDPTALKEVEESIRNNDYDEYQMSVVLRVLGKMNTKEAQILLSEVLIGLNPNETYMFWAAVELGNQTTVIPDMVKDRLFDKINDIGNIDSRITSASLYSLGRLAESLGSVDSDFSNDIKANLVDSLYATSPVETEKKSYILGALGNTKSDEYLDIGKTYIKSDNSILRQRAVTLVNNNSSDDATVTLEQQFLGDETDSLVKSQILNSLATRTHQDSKIIEEVKSLALNEDSRVIHDSSINYLIIQLGPTQKNKEYFIELLGQESSESNAIKLLNKIKTIK